MKTSDDRPGPDFREAMNKLCDDYPFRCHPRESPEFHRKALVAIGVSVIRDELQTYMRRH